MDCQLAYQSRTLEYENLRNSEVQRLQNVLPNDRLSRGEASVKALMGRVNITYNDSHSPGKNFLSLIINKIELPVEVQVSHIDISPADEGIATLKMPKIEFNDVRVTSACSVTFDCGEITGAADKVTIVANGPNAISNASEAGAEAVARDGATSNANAEGSKASSVGVNSISNANASGAISCALAQATANANVPGSTSEARGAASTANAYGDDTIAAVYFDGARDMLMDSVP